jgi:hypothetical protein
LLRCDDSEVDERVDRETCRALGVRSIVAVPIFSAGAVIGLLEMFSPNALAFSNAPDPAFEHFAEEISIALGGSARPSVAQGKVSKAPTRVTQPAVGAFAISGRERRRQSQLSGINRPRDLAMRS